MRIAAILTCHNRKEQTLRCLHSLIQVAPDIHIYLTDDGCTDGTAESVDALSPYIHIVKGDGTLFWNRGMHRAWSEALKGNYTHYLWLNDDVRLYDDFLNELIACEDLCGDEAIITGIIAEDKNEKCILYGGCKEKKVLIHPSGNPEPVTFMNGNVVLVPHSITERIGILDPILHHDLGDVDYGLTARKAGIGVYTTRKVIATGTPNNYCRVRKWNSSLTDRFKRLNTPLGSPLKTNFYFRNKHYGTLHALAYCIYITILNLLPDWCVTLIWKDTYIDK